MEQREKLPRILSTVAEAATALGIGRRTVLRRVADGSIRAVRLGGRVLIPVAELERLGRGA